jgi:hypothetical protein
MMCSAGLAWVRCDTNKSWYTGGFHLHDARALERVRANEAERACCTSVHSQHTVQVVW